MMIYEPIKILPAVFHKLLGHIKLSRICTLCIMFTHMYQFFKALSMKIIITPLITCAYRPDLFGTNTSDMFNYLKKQLNPHHCLVMI